MGSGHSSLGDAFLGTARHSEVGLLYPVLAALGVLLAEGALFVGQAENALLVHIGTVLFCLLVVAHRPETAVVLQPLALVPLFRVLSLGMPAFFETPVYQLLLVYLPLLPAIYLAGSWDGALSVDVPSRRTAMLAPVAIGAGVLLAAGEYAIVQPGALVPEWSATWVLTGIVILVGVVALVEELLFRGAVQRAIGAELGPGTGVVVASLLFGGVHAIYGSAPVVGFAVLVGLLLGVAYEVTDSVGLVTLAHGTLDVFLFVVLPLQGEALGLV